MKSFEVSFIVLASAFVLLDDADEVDGVLVPAKVFAIEFVLEVMVFEFGCFQIDRSKIGCGNLAGRNCCALTRMRCAAFIADVTQDTQATKSTGSLPYDNRCHMRFNCSRRS